MRKKNTVTTCHFKSLKWHRFAWIFPYRSLLSAFTWFRKRHILCVLCGVWYLSKHSRNDASLSLSVPKDGFEFSPCCSQVPATLPNAPALNKNELKKPGFCLQLPKTRSLFSNQPQGAARTCCERCLAPSATGQLCSNSSCTEMGLFLQKTREESHHSQR